MKRWKLALSLAVVAAIIVPALAGTWRHASGHWVNLAADQKQSISAMVEETNDCASFVNKGEYTRSICLAMRSELYNGGHWEPAEHVTPKYLATNLFVRAAGFVLAFALVMVRPNPPIGRRYLAWLRR